MPGIAGIISKSPREKNERDLDLMVQSMIHEPYYTSGTYVNEGLGLYAGWACQEGTFSDCMPVVNGRKDLALLFSGENFADRSRIEDLRRQGYAGDGLSADYLIQLYEEEGERFFEILNGFFSGLLVDLRNNRIVLFNDRYGMGRIYYHENEEEFIFSSEAKSLLKVRSKLREIDPNSLGQHFAWKCVLGDKTLFPEINKLPGGSRWSFENGHNAEKNSYFKPGMWESKPLLEGEAFYEGLRETFSNILPRYFQGRDTITMALSSGLDTRLILAHLKAASGEISCHTFAGAYRQPLDGIIGSKIAEAFGQSHQVLSLDEDYLTDFPSYCQKTIYVTDGCHDVMGTHDIFFNKLVRNIGTIRMTGKFGSEIVRSSCMLNKPYNFLDGFFNRDFDKLMNKAATDIIETKKGHRLTFAAFKEMPWYEYGCLAMENSILTLRSPFMDNDLVELMYQAPEGARDSDDLALRLVKGGNPEMSRIMTDRGTAGNLKYPLDKLALAYYDFLVKSEYVYLYMLPHWMAALDKVFSPLHPERFFAGRYQLGYYRLWFRDKFSEFIQDIMLDERTLSRPFFNRNFIEKMVLSHTKGTGNYTGEINKALTAELIHRQLVEDI
jgi:asparagine synthase (glutamine-hydrolysing)